MNEMTLVWLMVLSAEIKECYENFMTATENCLIILDQIYKKTKPEMEVTKEIETMRSKMVGKLAMCNALIEQIKENEIKV